MKLTLTSKIRIAFHFVTGLFLAVGMGIDSWQFWCAVTLLSWLEFLRILEILEKES